MSVEERRTLRADYRRECEAATRELVARQRREYHAAREPIRQRYMAMGLPL